MLANSRTSLATGWQAWADGKKIPTWKCSVVGSGKGRVRVKDTQGESTKHLVALTQPE